MNKDRGETTLSGRIIETKDEEDENFPLLHLLERVSRSCWYQLAERGRTEADVAIACRFLETDYAELLAMYRDMEASRQKSEQDHYRGSMWEWVYDADMRMLVEFSDDDWAESIPRSPASAEKWQWAEVDLLLSLMAIENAVEHIEERLISKAAAWALYATEWARSGLYWASHDEKAAAADLGRRGAAAKHKRNRELRMMAIAIYESKAWPSLAEAARKIAPQVSITDAVVLKWLRKHRQTVVSLAP